MLRQLPFLLLLLAIALPARLMARSEPAAPGAAAEPPITRACREAAQAEPPSRRLLRQCSRAISRPGLPPPIRLAMLMNRGIAQLRTGDAQAAAADFDLAIRAAPQLPEAWINKGLSLMRLTGRLDEAVALISHGIALGPREPARAYFARAQAQEAAGRLRDAMEDYAAAARADPAWPAPAEELRRFHVERRKVLRG